MFVGIKCWLTPQLAGYGTRKAPPTELPKASYLDKTEATRAILSYGGNTNGHRELGCGFSGAIEGRTISTTTTLKN